MFPLTTHPHLFHAVCEALALSGGTYYYRWLQQRAGVPVSALLNGSRFAVLLGCIFGAAIGNKIMFWIEVPHLLPLFWNRLDIWFAGQSIGAIIQSGNKTTDTPYHQTQQDRKHEGISRRVVYAGNLFGQFHTNQTTFAS